MIYNGPHLALAAQAAALAAPPVHSGQIDDGVGLTDAPLKSLYPEVPVLPKVTFTSFFAAFVRFCMLSLNQGFHGIIVSRLSTLKRVAFVQDAPKLKAAIVGSGLAGLSTAVELLDQGYEVDIYESRPFIGGKVASWQKDGNHVEMGLHVVSLPTHTLTVPCDCSAYVQSASFGVHMLYLYHGLAV